MPNILQLVFLCFPLFSAAVAEELIYARVGESVTLKLPDQSNKYLNWFFENKPILWLNPSGGRKSEWGPRLIPSPRSLLIKNLMQTDFGDYKCTVSEKLNQVAEYHFTLIQLKVAVDPAVVLPGEHLSLICESTSQSHHPQIHWLDPQRQRMNGSGGRPQVQATSLHSGQWTCVVAYDRQERQVKVKVTVIDLLPAAPFSTQFTSASYALTVPCSLAPSSTWDQVMSKGALEAGWNFCPLRPEGPKSGLFLLSLGDDKSTWETLTDRALQPSLQPRQGDLSLGRKLALEGDSGDYEFFMKFQNGLTINRTVRVEVLRIIASPGTNLTEGQELNLTCTTGRPLPPDTHTIWFPRRAAASSDPRLGPFTTVKRVRADQSGTWRCELRRGRTFLTSATVVLNIEPQSIRWMLLTLCAAVTVSVLLVILTIILWRRRKRGRRHVRLCRCKNPKPKGLYRS